ncbi:hypothetical protein NDU88_002061 [Pleurodeles waltl]|uniref:Reverse transcriptase domain-containing protein n=1 Tax=Pleurodeles waltl TaxID=8319 RepID=A0AAV7LZF6_PLEWA|nr:hypothetical protein NDU88_002061 [Pleurodeles waltl]
MLFSARQLQEKSKEQNKDPYTTFVNLSKAFDIVSRERLWRIMEKFGCPGKFTGMVRQFHVGMLAQVQDDGDSSNAFPFTNRVKQGCVLALTLFSMMFLAMLLFNLRRLQAKTKVEEDSVCDFLSKDDCALNAATEAQMQQNMNHFSSACRNSSLTIRTKKTEVLHQLTPQKTYAESTITTEGEILKAVDKFTYLSSIPSRPVNVDDEVDIPIAKASSAFGRLWESVWERTGIKLPTKLKIYKAVRLPTLLYACETWTVYERHAKKLNCFHMNCLRRLLKITWQDKVPDTDVLSQAGLPSIYTLLSKVGRPSCTNARNAPLQETILW